jgi:hypothetical protein
VRLLNAVLPLHKSLSLFNPDLADFALLLVNCAADVVLYCQDLYKSFSVISLWYNSFAALTLYESLPLFDLYLTDLAPFCY